MTPPRRSVALDLQGAQNAAHLDRGIPRYVIEHARALLSLAPEVVHSVLLSPQRPLTGNVNWLLGSELLAWAVSDYRPTRRPSGMPALYHVMSPFELDRPLEELWPLWARNPGVRTVVTLYDLIPLVFEEHYLRDPVMRERYMVRSRLVRQADHVLAISETTAHDAIERLNVREDRVTVIHAGATSALAETFSSPADAARFLAKARSEVRPGFLLYVGGFEFRKNLQRLVQAYGLLPGGLRRSHQLVITCSLLESERELLRSWAEEAGVAQDELVLTGYVSDSELSALYRACTLFVFPSFYEGSGLPILEAMSCGAPVVASATATGPEILGGTEGTFDPLSPESIADAIADALASDQTLVRLRERSRARVAAYTWSGVAEASLEAYAKTLSRPRRLRRPRLAMVTPWPPEQSGIADYSYRLARELGRHVDVDVIVGHPLSDYAEPLEQGVQLLEAASMRAIHHARQHDRFLFCMGNSSFHRHAYELLRERPGAVIAHDVRLTGFYGWFAGVERPDAPAARLRERIEALYGARIPPRALAGGAPTPQLQSELGIFMTREIQQYAEQLFVHSRFARDVLELDRGLGDRDVPVLVMPFGVPEPKPRTPIPPDTEALVVTVGVVSEVKGLAQLIDGFAALALGRPGIRLAIVGPAPDDELERWRTYASEHAPDADIAVTGHVSEGELRSLLSQAAAAVQLRTVSNGEASAAVADCLAAGLPTLVTAVGWAAELPEKAVVKLPMGADARLLAERISVVLDDRALRSALEAAALEHARANSFPAVAEHYLSALGLG